MLVRAERFSTYCQSARIAGTGLDMIDFEVEDGVTVGLTAEMIRAQLDLLVRDDVFRASRRSVAFLRYVVEQTLNGSASQIKERTIGVEVFGREPTYDTNLDHIVRTAATELRKRLAIYYGDESTVPSCGWGSSRARTVLLVSVIDSKPFAEFG